MAIFRSSYPIIQENEGGYANNPLDNGKETYCGISRKYHPLWGGWAIIDRFKAKGAIKTNTVFSSLSSLVEGFYFGEYWDKLYLAFFSQSLANQLFDFAVNSGKGEAVRQLQTILNRSGFRLKVDGSMGRLTARAAQAVDNEKLAKLLYEARVKFIEEEIKDQPHFARVWRKRLNYLQSFLSSQPTQLVMGFGVVVLVGFALFYKSNS